MRNKYGLRALFLLITLTLLIPFQLTPLLADEIVLKDGRKLIGIVLSYDLSGLWFLQTVGEPPLLKIPRDNVMVTIFTPLPALPPLAKFLPGELLGYKMSKAPLTHTLMDEISKMYGVKPLSGAVSLWVSDNELLAVVALNCSSPEDAERIVEAIGVTERKVMEVLKVKAYWMTGSITLDGVNVICGETTLPGTYLGLAQWRLGSKAFILCLKGPSLVFSHEYLMRALLATYAVAVEQV